MNKAGYTFTLYINPKTKEVFKANHKSLNRNTLYLWIMFVVILNSLNFVKENLISYERPITLFTMTIITIVIGMGIGIFVYKKQLESYDLWIILQNRLRIICRMGKSNIEMSCYLQFFYSLSRLFLL